MGKFVSGNRLRSPTSLKKSEILNLEPIIIDWEPMVRNILLDSSFGASSSGISAKFHNTLVEMIVEMAKRVGEEQIVLTGGCFQNRYLIERTMNVSEQKAFDLTGSNEFHPMMAALRWVKSWQRYGKSQEGKSHVFSSSRKNHQYQCSGRSLDADW